MLARFRKSLAAGLGPPEAKSFPDGPTQSTGGSLRVRGDFGQCLDLDEREQARERIRGSNWLLPISHEVTNF